MYISLHIYKTILYMCNIHMYVFPVSLIISCNCECLRPFCMTHLQSGSGSPHCNTLQRTATQCNMHRFFLYIKPEPGCGRPHCKTLKRTVLNIPAARLRQPSSSIQFPPSSSTERLQICGRAAANRVIPPFPTLLSLRNMVLSTGLCIRAGTRLFIYIYVNI